MVCAMASRPGHTGSFLAPAISSSEAPAVRMKCATVSPRRPSASNASNLLASVGEGQPHGTSYTASLSIATPAAAACSARPPPDEAPNRCADPPAAPIVVDHGEPPRQLRGERRMLRAVGDGAAHQDDGRSTPEAFVRDRRAILRRHLA